LRDLWREQHPGGVSPLAGEKKDGGGGEGGGECWERPNYTWRGQRSRTPGVVARYEGKAMRLDYVLLAPARIGVSAVATKRKGPVDSNSHSSNSHSSSSHSSNSHSSSNSSHSNDNSETRQIGAVSTKRQGSGGAGIATRELVADCKIRGHGTKMEGLFCGLDHSAVELKLFYRNGWVFFLVRVFVLYLFSKHDCANLFCGTAHADGSVVIYFISFHLLARTTTHYVPVQYNTTNDAMG